MPTEIGERKKEIAIFLLMLLLRRRTKLIQFLIDFAMDEADIRPIETDPGRLRLEFQRPRQSRKRDRHIIQGSTLNGLFLPRLCVLPETLCERGGPGLF